MARIFQSLGELGAYVEETGMQLVDPGVPLWDATSRGPDFGTVWRDQPSVRKVVSFIASNIAAVALHTFERVADSDRRRVTTGPLAATLQRPSSAPAMTPYRFWQAVLIDGLLYDRWCLMKTRRDDGSLELTRIPARRVWFKANGLDQIVKVQVWTMEGGFKELDPDGFILDAGYAQSGASGTPPIDTLRAILEEAAEAVDYRRGLWTNAARVPAVLERDKPWSSDGAYERFKASWQAFIKGGGNEGGTPILEDGMKLEKFEMFSPDDTHDLEGRQLTDVQVASAYHIAPELVGARQGTYSNMDAYRQMLYRDNLGGYIAGWEQAVNAGLVPVLAEGRDLYVEANLESKLRGSFLEQAQVLQTATGAPYMLREEARQRMNLPHIDGADELVVPLNVLIGGQASPNDSGSQNLGPKRGGPQTKALDAGVALRLLVKARHTENQAKKVTEILQKFFSRQGAAVLSAIGAGEQYWWDGQRWDEELTKDLHAVAMSIAGVIGPVEAEALGFAAGDYDPDLTVHYLQAVAKNYAESINLTTKDQLDVALGDADAEPADVFTKAHEERAGDDAGAVSKFVAGFAAHEAARQIQQAHNATLTKTWVTGSDPRPTHARMNGETVGIDATFSNGQKWPGGPGGGKDDVGCNCDMTTQLEPEEG